LHAMENADGNEHEEAHEEHKAERAVVVHIRFSPPGARRR
jgi:hypothetical protein